MKSPIIKTLFAATIAVTFAAVVLCTAAAQPVDTTASYEDRIEQLENSRTNERIVFVCVIVVGIIAAFVVNAANRRRIEDRVRAKLYFMESQIDDKMNEIEHQKEMLMKTEERISESINYALRIQHSILPAPEQLNSYPITESFIFYCPLDVVSGDFYWFTRKGDNLIVCCADCTGHGVPGAFMSMIASTIINSICIAANDDIRPSEILERLDDRLIENLSHNTNDVDAAAKDGLDISIASINLNTKLVTVAGARRPVIIFKNHEQIVVRGTKRSIGDTDPIIHSRFFIDTEIQLSKGDVIYMFSDGYSDQIGGEKNEKMTVKRVERMLNTIHDDDMDEQNITMQELFTQWKGDYPQIDDVLFIGIKI